MPKVTLSDICYSFGINEADLPQECLDILNNSDFSYRILDGEEKSNAILSILKTTERDTQKIGEPYRTEVWEKGWQENLTLFKNGYDLDSIIPKFIRPNNLVRYKQQLIIPNDKQFELNYCRLFQNWFFRHYCKSVETIYEFGCGSGFNLVALAKMFPSKKLVGTDFVPSAIELVNEIGRQYNFQMSADLFDMKSPTAEYKLEPNSVVLTFGAIEQLAGHFHDFVSYLRQQEPALCAHVEPTMELYDSDNLVDYLALQFHKKRGYSRGFLTHLQDLEKKGMIQLIKVKRTYLGNDRLEGYNYIIWRPL